MEIPANDWAKREALRRLIREAEPTLNNAIVFCNRKRDVDVVAKSLTKHGFDAAPIHGDLDQSLRTKTLDRFRAGELKILVASDVAARGLDVPAVSHIFNFDVPIHADDYVHRIGRTGRAGRSGQAYMLASPRDNKYVEFIEKLTGNKLARRQMTDLEVREDRAPRRDDKRGGRDRGRGPKRDHDRRPPGGKFHDQVAPTEPVREALVEASTPQPAILDAPQREQPRDQKRHEQSRPERPHREPKPHPEKKMHDKPRGRSNDAEIRTVDKSELPAFLFRKVPLAKREPQE